MPKGDDLAQAFEATPPLDPLAARFLQMLAATAPLAAPDRSLAGYRRGYDRLCAFAAAPYELHCQTKDTELSLPGRTLPLRIYEAKKNAKPHGETVIWFHGGGWIAGGLDSCDLICRVVADALDARVFSVGYRLAPEHPALAALADGCDSVLALFERLRREEPSRPRVSVGGDSAGAQIAVAACIHAREAGLAFDRQILLCPVLDPFGDWPSRKSYGRGFLLEESALADYAAFWGPDLDREDPRLSPLRAGGLDRLPPAHIHTASHDPVRDEGRAYAQALRRAGVPIRYVEHAGMIHNFFTLGKFIPGARAALARMADDLRSSGSPPLSPAS